MTKRCAFSHALASHALMAAVVVFPAAASVEALDCPVPPELGTLLVAADKVTLTWPVEASATRYAVVRGRTSALPVGPGGGDETCFLQ